MAFVFEEDGELFLTNIDDSSRQRLTRPGRNAMDESPVWSPDLDPATPGYQGEIAFLRWPEYPRLDLDLYAINSDGSNLRLFQSFRYDNDDPLPVSLGWSPNGQEILCNCHGSREGAGGLFPAGLYAVDALVGGFRRVCDMNARNFTAFSASRFQIADYGSFDGVWGIWTVDFMLDENGLLVVDPATLDLLIALPSRPDVERMAWSPDGLFLACLKKIELGDQYTKEVSVINPADGGELVVYQDDRLDPSGLTWSPDTLQIGIVLVRDTGHQAYTWDIARLTDWWDPVKQRVVLVTDTIQWEREVSPDWHPGWSGP